MATPGAPDLDCDIRGVIIRGVIRHGREFILSMTGKAGRWVDADSGEMVTVDLVPEMTYTCGYAPSVSDAVLDALQERFTCWHETSATLRLVSAPGKMTCLIETSDTWVPLPRTTPSQG